MAILIFNHSFDQYIHFQKYFMHLQVFVDINHEYSL